MKINLGCGRLKYSGWVNVDSSMTVGADVVANMTDYVAGLPDGSVAEARLIHSFEHLPRPEALELVNLLFRKLAPGGIVAIEVPDLLKCLEQLRQAPAGAGAVANIFGHYAMRGEVEHRWAYTGPALERILREAGFVDVREDDKRNYAHPRLGLARDVRIVGRKP